MCLIRKCQVQGLRSQKKRSLHLVNEHFYDKYNAEIGVFLQTLFNIHLTLAEKASSICSTLNTFPNEIIETISKRVSRSRLYF
jgi:hypothetical protein